jgi:hypothetical protein
LIVHHDFNDNGTDNSGNYNDISLNNLSHITSGLCDAPLGAITCPNTNDNASFSSPITLGSSYTVSVWFNLTEDKYSQTIIGNYVACQSQNSGFTIIYYGSPAQNNPRLRLFYGTNSYEHHGDLVDNQWHHTVLVVDNGTYYCYLDNTLISTKTNTASHSTNTIYVGNSDKTAPGCGSGNSMNCTGAIDELRMYSYALSNTEVTAIFENEICDSEIILCSSFTGNADDESGNDFHGTVNNGAALTEGLNDETDGAYTFSGSTSHIDYGDTIDFDTVFSVSVWFNLSEDRYVQNIVGNHVHCSFVDKGFGIWNYGTDATNPRLRFQVGSSNYEELINLADNEWHHAVLVIGRIEATAYLDGAEVGTISNSYSSTTESLLVGYQDAMGSGCGFGNPTNTTGAIDNLKIYARELSGSDISEEYDANVITASSSVVEAAPFNVYPNPTTGFMTVEGATFKSFEVISNVGKTQLKGQVLNNAINLSPLNTGTYTLKLIDANGVVKSTPVVIK